MRIFRDKCYHYCWKDNIVYNYQNILFSGHSQFRTPLQLLSPNDLLRVNIKVGFHWILEYCAFVVSITPQILDSEESIHNSYLNFGTKFSIHGLFSSDDSPDSWLRDAHDPVIYLVSFHPVHVLVLGIQCSDHLEPSPTSWPEAFTTGIWDAYLQWYQWFQDLS